MMKALFKPRGRHAERLPDMPEDAAARTEMLPLAAPVLDDTQAWPAPEPSPPLPKRVPFRERCQPAFRPDVSATIRADLRDLPAFRATVRTSGLAGLHMRSPAGPRTERKLP
jgi:hypothetical protein